MNWYLSKIVYRIICGEGLHAAQFDEQLRLVTALCASEAYDKAYELGKQEQESFLNRKNEVVMWQFINVSEIKLLNALEDGMEVYSRIEEKDHADTFIRAVNKKAEQLVAREASALHA